MRPLLASCGRARSWCSVTTEPVNGDATPVAPGGPDDPTTGVSCVLDYGGAWCVLQSFGGDRVLMQLKVTRLRRGRVVVFGPAERGLRSAGLGSDVDAGKIADALFDYLSAQPDAAAAIAGWREHALSLSAKPGLTS